MQNNKETQSHYVLQLDNTVLMVRESQHKELSAFVETIGNVKIRENRREKSTAVVLDIESFEIKERNGKERGREEVWILKYTVVLSELF